MEIILLVIGILTLLASGIWYLVEPGFGQLITALGGLAALIGYFYAYRQKVSQNAPSAEKSARKSIPYDILPISFELWLRQQIPSIEIWLYVVNYEPKELILQTFQIPNLHLQSGPSIDKISIDQEVRVPAHQSRQILCRRNLIDSEARAVEQTQRQAGNLSHPNATFSVVTRGLAGRKKLSRDIPSLSMNGWAKDVPLQSGGGTQDSQPGKELSHSESQEATSVVSSKPIRYGAVIKLIHDATGYSLHSHSRNYEHKDTSGQQQVTGNFGSDDGDYWIVKGPHNSPDTYKKGELIHSLDTVRLEHRITRTNLHSHAGVPSPMSGQQEVTAFGRDGKGDTNDNWRVDIQGDGDWLEGIAVRLIHMNTGVALHLHGVVLPDWALNQQEVTGYSGRDQNDLWKAVIFQETVS